MSTNTHTKDNNQLYPIFLKMDLFTTLIVGGGAVALEKLGFLLKSSPNANVKLVAGYVREDVLALGQGKNVAYIHRNFLPEDLDGVQMVIAATNDLTVNHHIHALCKERKILINVADTPPLCDFYLGGIVSKGPIKIAISTNGTSPTLAKRLRQILEDAISDNVVTLAHNLDQFRKTLSCGFEEKVSRLNELTASLVEKSAIEK